MTLEARLVHPPLEGHELDAIEQRVAAGDRKAFEDLYDALAPNVYSNFASTLGRERADALTAAILVASWKEAPTIRARRRSIAGWALHRTSDLIERERHRSA